MEALLGYVWYHIRLTTDKPLDDIKKFINLLGDKWIICNEIDHYHSIVMTNIDKTKIRTMINDELKLKGNKSFSLSVVRNKTRACKYVLKDGHFIYHGFDDNQISVMSALAHKKGNDKFALDLEQLELEFFEKKFDFRNFKIKYVKLLCDYNKKYYLGRSQLLNYFHLIYLKAFPLQHEEFVDQVCTNTILCTMSANLY